MFIIRLRPLPRRDKMLLEEGCLTVLRIQYRIIIVLMLPVLKETLIVVKVCLLFLGPQILLVIRVYKKLLFDIVLFFWLTAQVHVQPPARNFRRRVTTQMVANNGAAQENVRSTNMYSHTCRRQQRCLGKY